MKKYYMIFAGLDSGGMSAENNCCYISYTTEEIACNEAYEASIEAIQSYEGLHGVPIFTDEESEWDEEGNTVPYEEIENYTDYYVEVVTQEQLENHDMMDHFITVIELNKHNKEEVFKEYNIDY